MKKHKNKLKQIKEIRLLASSHIPYRLTKACKSRDFGVKLLSEGLQSDTLMYANRNQKQGHRSRQV